MHFCIVILFVILTTVQSRPNSIIKKINLKGLSATQSGLLTKLHGKTHPAELAIDGDTTDGGT